MLRIYCTLLFAFWLTNAFGQLQLYPVQNAEGLWGMADSTGKLVVPHNCTEKPASCLLQPNQMFCCWGKIKIEPDCYFIDGSLVPVFETGAGLEPCLKYPGKQYGMPDTIPDIFMVSCAFGYALKKLYSNRDIQIGPDRHCVESEPIYGLSSLPKPYTESGAGYDFSSLPKPYNIFFHGFALVELYDGFQLVDMDLNFVFDRPMYSIEVLGVNQIAVHDASGKTAIYDGNGVLVRGYE